MPQSICGRMTTRSNIGYPLAALVSRYLCNLGITAGGAAAVRASMGWGVTAAPRAAVVVANAHRGVVVVTTS